jgi:ABC-type transport system substrate-binding protein
MRQHRCVLGSDGIWSCRGTRASIRFATTTGNARRAFVQEQLIAQARAVGIELVPDNSSSSVLFGTRLPAGEYELTMFAWGKSVDPFGLGTLYGCDGASNYMRYCSPKVTDLLEAADQEVRSPAALLHRADGMLADDVPSIPFFQAPLVLAHWTQLQGIELNAGPQGLTWNLADWRIG